MSGSASLMSVRACRYLVDGVLQLPAAWHTVHHSGDTIDRINQGTEALHDYAESTFEVCLPH